MTEALEANRDAGLAQTGKINIGMVNGFDPSSLGRLDPATQELVRRRQAAARAGLPADVRRPGRDRPRRRLPALRQPGQRISRRLQQRRLRSATATRGWSRPFTASCRRSARTPATCRMASSTSPPRIVPTFGAPIEHLMFTCTGSEANDLAVRIAKHHTGKQGVIITSEAYHGNSELTAGFSPSLGRSRRSGTGCGGFRRPTATGWRPGDGREARRRGRGRRSTISSAAATGSRPSSPTRCSPRTGSTPSPTRPARARSPRSCSRPAACSSPTRCRRASAGRASALGLPAARPVRPTSSRWASRWATAIRSPPSALAPRRGRAVRSGDALLQHLRRQQRRGEGGAGDLRRDPRREPASRTPRVGDAAPGRHPRARGEGRADRRRPRRRSLHRRRVRQRSRDEGAGSATALAASSTGCASGGC